MKFVWLAKQPEAKEVVSAKPSTPLTFDEYQKAFENLDPAEKQKFLEKTKKWDQDFNGYAVQEIRHAGLSKQEMQSAPDKAHILLSSLYLQQVEGKPNTFKANFQGNYLAEYKAIGWGDVLPWTAKEIKVCDQNNQVICERAIRCTDPNTGREGYFEAQGMEQKPPQYHYVFMYTNYTAEILKKVTPAQALADEKRNKENASQQHVSHERRQDLVQNIEGKSPTQVINARLQALGQNVADMSAPLESLDTRTARGRIAAIAKKYAGTNRFEADFQSMTTLENGNVGCAWVASTILVEAGILNQKIQGVDGVTAELKAKGWRRAAPNEPPEPGDVVVWERLPGKTVIYDDGSESWMPGHKHIGIVVGPNAAVDNRGPKGPQTGALFRPHRGIEAILKPPKDLHENTRQPGENNPKGISNQPPGAGVETKSGKNEKTRPYEKFNTSDIGHVLSKNPDWNRALDEAMKAYNVPERYKYIFCFIMNIESKFNPTARPRNKDGRLASSAYGLGQTLDETWNGLQKKMQGNGLMPSALAYRNGEQPPEWQIKSLVTFIMTDILPNTGLKLSDDPAEIAKIYLCYHDGWAGYVKSLKPWFDANGGRITPIPNDAVNKQYMKFDFQRDRGAEGTNQIIDYAYNNAKNIAMKYKEQLSKS